MKRLYVPTKQDLLEIFGLDSTTLDTYLAQPGAPRKHPKRGWDVDSVRRFLAREAKSEGVLSKVDDGIRDLKLRELRAKCQKIEFLNDVKAGKYVLREQRDHDVRCIITTLVQALEELPSQLAAPYGSIGPEIEAHAEKVIREWRTRIADDFKAHAEAGNKAKESAATAEPSPETETKPAANAAGDQVVG